MSKGAKLDLTSLPKEPQEERYQSRPVLACEEAEQSFLAAGGLARYRRAFHKAYVDFSGYTPRQSYFDVQSVGPRNVASMKRWGNSVG